MSVRTACGWPSKYFLAPIAEPPLARVCQHEFVGDFSHDVIGGYGGDLREGNFLEQSVALSRSAAQAIDEDIAVDEDFRPIRNACQVSDRHDLFVVVFAELSRQPPLFGGELDA